MTLFKNFNMSFFTIIMMGLASLTAGAEVENSASCSFNKLCTCKFTGSSTVVFNEISCIRVPFAKPPMPKALATNKVTLLGNGLEILDHDSFKGFSLIGELNLAYNKLHFVSPTTLSNFSSVLQALDLSYNGLQNVPADALQNCTALKVLSLERNAIVDLKVNWGQLEDSLEFLFLSGNNIVQVPVSLQYTLANIKNLKTLNLDNNCINYLEENSVPFSLLTLSVASNCITEFPSALFNNLYVLRKLNLADNNIKDLPDFKYKFGKSLDILDLSNNLIRSVEDLFGKSFKIQQLILSNNQIGSIGSRAFDGIDCKKIDLSGNKINVVSEKVFLGLSSLEFVDLSRNKLVRIPKALGTLKRLNKVFFSYNGLTVFPDASAFRNSSGSLSHLALSHNHIKRVSKSTMIFLRRLETLDLGYNEIGSAAVSPFMSNNLHSLSLESNLIRRIGSEDFKYLTRMEKLNLAYNPISGISIDAFKNNVNLKKLDLGFSLKSVSLPQTIFSNLANLKELYLDNNQLSEISPRLFQNLHSLKYLTLAFNRLSSLTPGLLQQNVLTHLEWVHFSFNRLTTIESNTLSNLQSLKFASLAYNVIQNVEQKAFVGLREAITLDLSHNQIVDIAQGAFVNLPNLSELDLSHNELSLIDWRMFENVSRSEQPMLVNLSFNRIASFLNEDSGLYIRTLDLSHNLMHVVPGDSLRALASSLLILNLGYNHIKEVRMEALSNSIETLNLEHNMIERVVVDGVQDVGNLQVLDLSHNHLSFVPRFSTQPHLRILDLSYNLISSVPEDCFAGTNIESLNLAHNQLTVIPINSLVTLGEVICTLDLSFNKVDVIVDDQFKATPHLTDLDISYNSFNSLPENAFQHLNSLLRLNLRGNRFGGSLGNFNHNASLHHLDLSETQISELPLLQQPNLVTLNASGNGISELKYGFLVGLPALRTLDLSRNNITTLSKAGWILAGALNNLDVSSNPIKALLRDSFDGLKHLRVLNLQNLNNLVDLSSNAFSDLTRLKHLKFQAWAQLNNYAQRLSSMISRLDHLQALSIQVDENKPSDELFGDLPEKLRLLEITGGKLEMLSALGDQSTPFTNELTVRITRTNISMLPSYFFNKFRAAKLTIDLRENSLTAIGRHNFYYSQKSVTLQRHGTQRYKGGIYLDGNHLSCDCGAHWMASWLRRYLREVVKFPTSNHLYLREKIEEMMLTECFNPLTGEQVKLLTFENDECKPSVALNISLSLHGNSVLLLLAVLFLSTIFRV